MQLDCDIVGSLVILNAMLDSEAHTFVFTIFLVVLTSYVIIKLLLTVEVLSLIKRRAKSRRSVPLNFPDSNHVIAN
jgi:hypothetical protein